MRPTRHARAAAEVWSVLPVVMGARWRGRFGDPAIDALCAALEPIYGALGIDPPAYLPPSSQGRTARPMRPSRARGAGGSGGALARRISGRSWPGCCSSSRSTSRRWPGSHWRPPPTRCACSTRRGAHPGPGHTDRRLEGGQCHVPRLAAASRLCGGGPGPQRTTRPDAAPHHQRARRAGQIHAHLGRDGRRLRHNLRTDADRRRPCCARTPGGRRHTSGVALAAGLDPYPDNWRAGVRPASTLPHYAMVLHRGAYPDGS